MKGSTIYLNWFRRLLVLGAVVAAGVITTSAGAFAGQSTDVSTPPDVQDFATALHQTPGRPHCRRPAAPGSGGGLQAARVHAGLPNGAGLEGGWPAAAG